MRPHLSHPPTCSGACTPKHTLSVSIRPPAAGSFIRWLDTPRCVLLLANAQQRIRGADKHRRRDTEEGERKHERWIKEGKSYSNKERGSVEKKIHNANTLLLCWVKGCQHHAMNDEADLTSLSFEYMKFWSGGVQGGLGGVQSSKMHHSLHLALTCKI